MDESKGAKRWRAFKRLDRQATALRRALRALRRRILIGAPPPPAWYLDDRIHAELYWLRKGRAWCDHHRHIVEAALPNLNIVRLSQRVDEAVGDDPVAPTSAELAGIVAATQFRDCPIERMGDTPERCDAALRDLIRRGDRNLN
jgi:transposase